VQRRLGRKKKVAARGEVAWPYKDLFTWRCKPQIKSLAVDPLRKLGCSVRPVLQSPCSCLGCEGALVGQTGLAKIEPTKLWRDVKKMDFYRRPSQCTRGVVESNVLHVAPLIVCES
jgi:hypothetical protein